MLIPDLYWLIYFEMKSTPVPAIHLIIDPKLVINCCYYYLSGMMTSRMAFSCTCQPKRKEPNAQRTMQRMKPFGPSGHRHRWIRLGYKYKEPNDWF